MIPPPFLDPAELPIRPEATVAPRRIGWAVARRGMSVEAPPPWAVSPCYPLTITDYRSRYLLACEGLSSTRSDFAFSVFERAFKDLGLPGAIRTDDGTPFASPNALFGLSKLSVWWLRLGIQLQRIEPGCPQQNGRHERMHPTLKKEATKPASFNFLQQQERFDQFIGVYNNERPHQALGGAYPGDLYTPSARTYAPPAEPEYPYHDKAVRPGGLGLGFFQCVDLRPTKPPTVRTSQRG